MNAYWLLLLNHFIWIPPSSFWPIYLQYFFSPLIFTQYWTLGNKSWKKKQRKKVWWALTPQTTQDNDVKKNTRANFPQKQQETKIREKSTNYLFLRLWHPSTHRYNFFQDTEEKFFFDWKENVVKLRMKCRYVEVAQFRSPICEVQWGTLVSL